MHARGLLTILLLAAGMRGSVAGEESKGVTSFTVHDQFEDLNSLNETLRQRWAETGLGEGEDGSTTAETKGATARLITGITSNDSFSITIGLDTMFNLGAFLMALLFVSVVLGAIGIGSNIYTGIFSKDFYDKDNDYFTGDYSSYLSTGSHNQGYGKRSYDLFKALQEAKEKYDI